MLKKLQIHAMQWAKLFILDQPYEDAKFFFKSCSKNAITISPAEIMVRARNQKLTDISSKSCFITVI